MRSLKVIVNRAIISYCISLTKPEHKSILGTLLARMKSSEIRKGIRKDWDNNKDGGLRRKHANEIELIQTKEFIEIMQCKRFHHRPIALYSPSP
jgi:hypothetical protein